MKTPDSTLPPLSGAWPEKLDDLKDKALSEPFTGEPLKCRRTDDGGQVYSVGRNLKDDGGDNKSEGTGDTASRPFEAPERNSREHDPDLPPVPD